MNHSVQYTLVDPLRLLLTRHHLDLDQRHISCILKCVPDGLSYPTLIGCPTPTTTNSEQGTLSLPFIQSIKLYTFLYSYSN